MSGKPTGNEMDVASSVSSSDRHSDGLPYVHKVGVPPKQSLLKELRFTIMETFFHDDPVRPFKDQPMSRKFLLGIQAVFPILDWGREYKLHMFKGDLIAGLTIASLCIPQVRNRGLQMIKYSWASHHISTQPLRPANIFID